MKKGDLVNFNEDYVEAIENTWQSPGLIIKGPYGTLETVRSRWDGKVVESRETKVVDVLVDHQIILKLPIEKLKVIR